jgi:hypothetical protein
MLAEIVTPRLLQRRTILLEGILVCLFRDFVRSAFDYPIIDLLTDLRTQL